MCLGFLLSQPYTYKRIVLRAVKVDTSCTSVEQSLFKKIVSKIEFSLVHRFYEEVVMFVHLGFCNQAFSGSLLCDELKNFTANNLL